MSDNVQLRVGMCVNYIANSTSETVVDSGYTRTEWDAMSEEDREKVLNDWAEGEIDNHVETWAYVEGEN